MENFELVITGNEEPRVDSRDLAKALDIEHDSLMLNIKNNKKYFESEGHMKSGTEKNPKGHAFKFYLLTEDQAIFALTLSRNTTNKTTQ